MWRSRVAWIRVHEWLKSGLCVTAVLSQQDAADLASAIYSMVFTKVAVGMDV